MTIQLSTLIRRTRQHHALEHATIHLLAASHPYLSLAGWSDPLGFTLFGNVETGAVWQAVRQALLRLQAGESALARHPNCGTNLATKVVLVTGAGLLGGAGKRRLSQRITGSALLVSAALFVAHPLGMYFQKFTTLADVADCWLVNVEQVTATPRPIHRVTFGR
ncbi:MAG: hypothetical protein KF753_23090 [Caldilineaceae bacterium]|nr:hypothetical protein [Caldilineaceae bacterium]